MAKAEEDYSILAALAERLGLDEDQADGFVSSSMKRLGHKAKLMWEDGEDGGNDDSGDYFTRKRVTRDSRPPSNRENRSRRDGWQYGNSA